MYVCNVCMYVRIMYVCMYVRTYVPHEEILDQFVGFRNLV